MPILDPADKWRCYVVPCIAPALYRCETCGRRFCCDHSGATKLQFGGLIKTWCQECATIMNEGQAE